ncbi:MAG: hypothetical protein AB7F43_07565 [Bacteriovoracia bacterium]
MLKGYRGSRTGSSVSSGLILLVLTTIFSSSIFASNHSDKSRDESFKEACAALLEDAGSSDAFKKTSLRQQALSERTTLADFINPEREINIYQRPLNVLNAAQKVDYIFESDGFIEMPNPDTGIGKVRISRTFYDGGEKTNGLHMIEQYEPIHQLITGVKTASQGTSSGVYLVMFEGPPGTGKSKAFKIIKNRLLFATLNEADKAVNSYYWKNLRGIHSLHEDLPKLTKFGAHDKDTFEFDCPQHHSPFVLLPDPFKEAVLKRATPAVMDMIGVRPSPHRRMCDYCQRIHDKIIKHYSETEFGGRDLTPDEEFMVINRHIDVKRVIMGDPGTVTWLAAQSKQANHKTLFVDLNPVTYFNSQNRHTPFSYLPNGAFVTSFIVILDEILKNDPDLVKKLLNTVQDRSISEGGANIDLDVLFFAATNTQDIIEHNEREPQSAFMSRVKKVPFLHLLKPDAMAKALLEDLGRPEVALTATELGKENPQTLEVRKNINKIIPMRLISDEAKFPSKHFDMTIGEGKNHTHISPYSFEFLSLVFTLTRLNFDPTVFDKWEKYGSFPLVSNDAGSQYKDAIKRLNILTGKTQLNPDDAVQFWEASTLAREGRTGIDFRKVTQLFDVALMESRKDEHGFCLNPMILQKILKQQIAKEIITDNEKERTDLLRYAEMVFEHFILPEFRHDIKRAISGAKNNEANDIHDQVIREIAAQDSKKDSYLDGKTQKMRKVNEKRLKAIREQYKKITDHELDYREIVKFIYEMSDATGQSLPITRDPNLLRAISEYLESNFFRAHETDFERILTVLTDEDSATPEEKELFGRMRERIVHEMGYCPHCFEAALRAVIEHPGTQEQP